METHYHSQFDNDDFYDEKVYRFHHQLYGLLLMEIDQTPVAPLNPAELFAQIRRSIRPVTGEEDETAEVVHIPSMEEAGFWTGSPRRRSWETGSGPESGKRTGRERRMRPFSKGF